MGHGFTRRRFLEAGTGAMVGTYVALTPGAARAEDAGAPASQASADRAPEEGTGPFHKLVIRGGTLIDGTGAPPRGPVDIVVVNQRITQIKQVSERDLQKDRPPFDADHVVDATGMFVMPGFVDLHVHAGGPPKNPETYAYKLWLAHGVTTVRGVALASNDISVRDKERSERNEIVAPRIFNYQHPGNAWGKGPVNSAQSAREWVRWAKDHGVDGIKIRSGAHMRPDIMAALLPEAKRLQMGTVAHLDQTGVEQMNAIDAARLGLGTVTHFYGHFESLVRPGVKLFPSDYDYRNEQVRFSQVADWVNKIYPVRGQEWHRYLREHLELGTVFDPTFNIYVASRDVTRMRGAEWHDKYTLPSLWDFFQPSTAAHGSYYWDWGTEVETAWKDFYQVWFKLMKDYHDMGGRITTGSDSGFIYQTYGFAYIMELEMLREAGLTPLEVITAATLNGAKTLYEPMGIDNPPIGTVEPGKLADLVIAPEDPTADLTVDPWGRRGGGFKALYGTGHQRLNPQTGQIERVGGIRWTIKDGVVYDARRLLEDVAVEVEKQKAERGTS
ncbi:amidohydrolase family protein [Micromonospora sp. NPDC007271]|uniref:amidohydrolase family protein n=1 Tax=Micromonospora sp. NPDC007271 TaxID=3154587 RepID=UPI0033C37959